MVVRSEVGRLPYTRRQSEVVAVDEPAGRPFRSSITKRRTRIERIGRLPGNGGLEGLGFGARAPAGTGTPPPRSS